MQLCDVASEGDDFAPLTDIRGEIEQSKRHVAHFIVLRDEVSKVVGVNHLDCRTLMLRESLDSFYWFDLIDEAVHPMKGDFHWAVPVVPPRQDECLVAGLSKCDALDRIIERLSL